MTLPKEYQDYFDNMMHRMDNAKVHKCPECSESNWGMTIEPDVSLVCNNCEYSYIDDLLNRMIVPYLPKTQKDYEEQKKNNPFVHLSILSKVFRCLGKK
tara:strand:- start:611 stop:907 length:297 start_codon:yes stop_codon:yes gene_type:complete